MGLDMYLTAERNVPDLPEDLRSLFGGADQDDDGVYLSGWSHAEAGAMEKYKSALQAAGLTDYAVTNAPSGYLIPGNPPKIRIHVGYWRKANQIHNWFVNHCQGGVDECQLSDPISKEKLAELIATCRNVLDHCEMIEGDVTNGYTIAEGKTTPNLVRGQLMSNSNIAEQELPTSEGFFFGKTDYDQYYVSDLHDTIKILEPLLSAPDDIVFRYQSSW